MVRKIWDLPPAHEKSASNDWAGDIAAPILVVNRFTCTATRIGRPTWQAAAPGPVIEPLYDAVCAELTRLGARVDRGVFGADMRVASVNDGPVTLILESP